MKTFNIVVSVVVWLFSVNTSYAAFVSPIQADFGDVLPSYSASVDVFKANAPASYVSFNLLTTADVSLKVEELAYVWPGDNFHITGIALTSIDTNSFQYSSENFNLDTWPYDQVGYKAWAYSLPPGRYILEVTGTGNRELWGPGLQDWDLQDFNVQLQVSPPTSVPLPASIWLYGSAMAVLAGFSKVRRNGLA